MSRKLKTIISVLIIITILIPLTYSYAFSKPDENKIFFEVSKLEFSKNEKIEMTLNLNVIQYNNFTFELQASENMENVEIVQDNNGIETEKNSNEILMEISKEKTNVNTISLYYSIPPNKKVGDTIKFTATISNIISNENDEQEEKIESEIENPNNQQENIENINNDDLLPENNKGNQKPEENTESLNQDKQEVQKIEYVVKIVEEKAEEQQPNNNENNQIPVLDDDNKDIPNNQSVNKDNLPSINQKKVSQVSYSSMQNYGMNTSIQTTKVTYNGSDNNYLNKLSVKDCELNKGFSKDNSTYFITVENEINEIKIEAVADDSDAKVVIYGNDDLKEGTNKVLISVTAENGNVRLYRIYVIKNA